MQGELDLPASQLMGLFNRIIRKFVKFFNSIQEEDVGKTIPLIPPSANKSKDMQPMEVSLEDDLKTAGDDFVAKQTKESATNKELEKLDLTQLVTAKETINICFIIACMMCVFHMKSHYFVTCVLGTRFLVKTRSGMMLWQEEIVIQALSV